MRLASKAVGTVPDPGRTRAPIYSTVLPVVSLRGQGACPGRRKGTGPGPPWDCLSPKAIGHWLFVGLMKPEGGEEEVGRSEEWVLSIVDPSG